MHAYLMALITDLGRTIGPKPATDFTFAELSAALAVPQVAPSSVDEDAVNEQIRIILLAKSLGLLP